MTVLFGGRRSAGWNLLIRRRRGHVWSGGGRSGSRSRLLALWVLVGCLVVLVVPVVPVAAVYVQLVPPDRALRRGCFL